MPKPKTSPDLTPKPYRLLKSDIAAKLSARSTGGITYMLLADVGDEPELHIAVTANEGGGLWSKEAVALNTIETVLDAYASAPFPTKALRGAVVGRSSNNPPFCLAVLKDLGLVAPAPELLARLQPLCDAQGARLGLAPHSLRAVPPDALRDVLAGLNAIDPTAPIHIHIAEQTQEVQDCLTWSGQRPVAWLLDHAPVDARWCLVHATHMDDDEYRRAAATGAVAGLCPSTEANLGDGIFDLPRWVAAGGEADDPHAQHFVSLLPPEGAAPALGRPGGGAWGIGSDSHVTVNAAEELMLLEYSQRLATRRRNVAASAAHAEVATAMTLAAVRGGAQASGRPLAGLAVGQQADLVVLDSAHRALAGLSAPQQLAGHVFASHRTSAVHSVWVGGVPRVTGARHADHAAAEAGWLAARQQLLAEQVPAAS